MSHVAYFICQLGTQIQDTTDSHLLYAVPAVLATYILVVAGRARGGA